MTDRDQPVFIGPVCVGKSRVSALVADRLGYERVELDEIAMRYYRDCPEFDPDTYNHLQDSQGFVAAYRYWEPAVAYALERVVQDHPTAVLDLGAGHTCFLDPRLQARASRALQPYGNVVLLLPDPDPDVSVKVIRERCRQDTDRDGMTWDFDEVDLIRLWVEDDQNRNLANHVIYTSADTPEAVAELVLTRLS